jgi:hypothetical protein
MILWICRKCGHEVLANERPQSIKWTDGHICIFIKAPGEQNEKTEQKNIQRVFTKRITKI